MSGAALRNWQNINGLLQLGPVMAVNLKSGPIAAPASDLLQLMGFSIPRPLSVVGKAMLHAPEVIARHREGFLSLARRRELDRIKAKFQPDIVVLTELAWAPFVDRICHWNIPIIYDAHNVETKRFREMPDAALPSGEQRAREASEAERILVSAATQVWTCSAADRSEMAAIYGDGQKITVIPNGIDTTRYAQSLPEPPELAGASHRILYTGDYAYSPNAVAVERICTRLLPELRRRLGDVKLCLAGSNPTQSMLDNAARDPDIVVTGRVPDIRPYLKNCDCMLVPLESGGGTRLKILEAFAAGCPVVSTPKGAEGLAAEDGTHLLIGVTDDELAELTVEICSRCDMAAALTDNARRLIASIYDWRIVHRELTKAVAALWTVPVGKVATACLN
jgi:glycosyltransferase involved in cell wall biosynthesis